LAETICLKFEVDKPPLEAPLVWCLSASKIIKMKENIRDKEKDNNILNKILVVVLIVTEIRSRE